MSTLHAVPLERLAEVQRLLHGGAAIQEATYANVAEATTLHDPGLLIYRQRAYDVRPVPYRIGLKMLALDQELRRLATTEADDLEAVRRRMLAAAEFLALVVHVVRPRSAWGRSRPGAWRAALADAELEELNALRSFFCSARTRYPVVGVRSIRAPHWLRQTWPPSSPPLRVGMAAGWHATRARASSNPAAGDTSSWD